MKKDHFASMIQCLQLDAGLSRTEIAHETGLSRTTVWRLAEGVARAPGYQTIQRVERLYQQKLSVSPMKQKTR